MGIFGRRTFPEPLLRRLIAKGKEEALIAVFRQHYVEARNVLLKRDVEERYIDPLIEKAAVAVWCHYAAHPDDTTPIRDRFFHYIDHPEALISKADAQPLRKAIQHLYRFFDPVCMQLLMWRYAEGRSEANVGELADRSLSETQADLKRCMMRFRQAALAYLGKVLPPHSEQDLARVQQYVDGILRPEEALLLESEAAIHPPLRKLIEAEQTLRRLLRYGREEALQRYLQRHTTRRLLGNIWGRQWTIASALIIGLALIGMWWFKDTPATQPPVSFIEQDFTPPTHAKPTTEISYRRLAQLKEKASRYRHWQAGGRFFHLLFFPEKTRSVSREKNAFLLYGFLPTDVRALAIQDSTLVLQIADTTYQWPL